MNSLGQIIFDMDGTLVDSMPQHARAFSQILKDDYSIPVTISYETYFKTAGQPLDEQFSFVIKSVTGKQVKDVEILLEKFWELVGQITPTLFPEVEHAIATLSEAGYMLAVVSGCAPFIVEAKMRSSRVDRFFRFMLGTDKRISGMLKGEGHFTMMQHELGLSPESFRRTSCIVGDAAHDMEIGRRAGMVAIGRIGEMSAEALIKAGADLVVENLDELIDILKPSGSLSGFLPLSSLTVHRQ